MALYFLMLARGTAARATVNFYLVPGVTSVLTWAVLGERLTPVMILGLAISSAGCWLVGCWLVGRQRPLARSLP